MRRPIWTAGLAAAVIALAVLPAQAQPAVVAGASPGPTLGAEDSSFGRGLELLRVDLTPPAGTDPDDADVESETGDAPVWPDETLLAYKELPSDQGTRFIVGGAVAAQVASVEVGFGGPTRLRVATTDGAAYHGRWAGQLRFFVGDITVPGSDADDSPPEVRMFDAAGTLIGVANAPTIDHSARVLRRRAVGARIAVDAVLRSRPAPLPGAPDRRTDDLCMRTGVNGQPDELEVACEGREPLRVGGRRGCGRVPTTIAGVLPAAARTLELRLGSGRTMRLPARVAPFGRPDRVVAGFVSEAIRSAAVLDGGGGVLARGNLAVAPPDRRCAAPLTADALEFWNFVSDDPAPRLGTPPGTQLAAEAAGHRVLVRDSGDDLCLGIDRLDLDGADCFAPPVNSHFPSIYVDPAAGIVAGIFAAPVTSLDVGFRGGGSMTIPASEGTEYTGRWRSAVHFALAPIPAGRTVHDAELFDAGRRQIGTASVDGPGSDDTLIGPQHTVLQDGAGAAAARVVVGATHNPLAPSPAACFSLALGRAHGDCNDPVSSGQSLVTAVVPCAMRRTIVYGTVPRSAPRVEIGLAGGRTVQARMAQFPAGLGTHAKVFLAVLPRDVAVTRVRFAGQRRDGVSDTVRLPTRAPDRQCGYEVTRAID